MGKRVALVLIVAAVAAVTGGVVASSAQADSGLGGDCAVLGPIGSNAVPSLAPLQNESQAQAAPQLDAYLGRLRAQEGKLGTARGRADLARYINAVQNATSASDAPLIYGAINQLLTDCPS